jgi:hypothetical protein
MARWLLAGDRSVVRQQPCGSGLLAGVRDVCAAAAGNGAAAASPKPKQPSQKGGKGGKRGGKGGDEAGKRGLQGRTDAW